VERDLHAPDVAQDATKAKLLARRGQFPAARRLADEATALVSQTSDAVLLAQTLMDKAEVNRLAGARDQAAASLHAALRIYPDRHVAPLAAQANAALTSLTSLTSPAASRPKQPTTRSRDLDTATHFADTAIGRAESAFCVAAHRELPGPRCTR
jgi:hypothetical protein